MDFQLKSIWPSVEAYFKAYDKEVDYVTAMVNRAWTAPPAPTTFNTFCDKMEAAAGDAAKITAAKNTLWGSMKT